MKKIILIAQVFSISFLQAQNFPTPFEKSNGKETTQYFECISYYKQLNAAFSTILLKNFDTTDAGYPLHVALYSADKKFNPRQWHLQNKIVILVNNGIHPGEPDGIDASMILLRDIASGKVKFPGNVVLAIIPVYNIGGCLNRNSFSRVNQNGPDSYGFRGNAQNLDLNRDFIKADAKDTKSFEKIFHWINPDIFIDNHVSDGADYQHTMTVITTQHNKLGGPVGDFLHDVFGPALYKSMQEKHWPVCPYVNFEEGNTENGWTAFYDPPRYSSGYAALFETIAFMTETHMLKPFSERVKSTYAFMQTVIEQASVFATSIISKRKEGIEALKHQKEFVLSWGADTSKFEYINFKGYEASEKISEVTGMKRLYYDHTKPFEKKVKLYNTFLPKTTVEKPVAYILPQGWQSVIDLLQINGAEVRRFTSDTIIEAEYYYIDDYKSYQTPYEKHHRNYDISLTAKMDKILFLKGDCIINTGQASDRYIVETLEPLGDDSFFSWNFFDAVLQQKEGYSNYRWEETAAEYLQKNPGLKKQMEDRKRTDTAFAASSEAQLDFVYKHSPYYEPEHLRYPVYRLLK